MRSIQKPHCASIKCIFSQAFYRIRKVNFVNFGTLKRKWSHGFRSIHDDKRVLFFGTKISYHTHLSHIVEHISHKLKKRIIFININFTGSP